MLRVSASSPKLRSNSDIFKSERVLQSSSFKVVSIMLLKSSSGGVLGAVLATPKNSSVFHLASPSFA